MEEPADVATAHQISSVITLFRRSTKRSARCHVPVPGALTPVTMMLVEWICDSKTTRSPAFCGLIASVCNPGASLKLGKVAASEIVDPVADAAVSSPKVKTDDINTVDMKHVVAKRAVLPRFLWSGIIQRLLGAKNSHESLEYLSGRLL